MTLPAITTLYAALLGLVGLALAGRVGMLRVRTGVSIYDGGNKELAAAIRRHANFTEHVPLALILLALIEMGGAGATLMHVLGAALVACRIAHPLGLDADDMRKPLRGVGAAGTTLITLIASGVALSQTLL